MAVPRDRHKEVLRQTREERMRKIAMLAMQYERTISEMAQQQTVRDGFLASKIVQYMFLSCLINSLCMFVAINIASYWVENAMINLKGTPP